MRALTTCKRAFTLIELLVVVAIIAVLAAMLFPVFLRAKESAGTAKCASNMRQITQAWVRYTEDHNGRTPPFCGKEIPYEPWWETILPWPRSPWRTGILSAYLKSEKVAWCPAFQRETITHHKGCYALNGVYLVWGGEVMEWSIPNAGTSLVAASQIQRSSKTICWIDSQTMWASSPKCYMLWPYWGQTVVGARHNEGWNISFCDGHVKWYLCSRDGTVSADDYLWALDKTNYRGMKRGR